MLRAAFMCWTLLTGAVFAQDIAQVQSGAFGARFEAPTDRYGHAIMGDLPEWGVLCLSEAGAPDACVTLPDTSVFEDIAPRLHDLDGDGTPEAVVVESTTTAGAALVVYRREAGTLHRIAAPHIGTRNRWLAPIGVADMDGDGRMELAYIDRPHLAKTLRLWRYVDGALRPVADLPGYTNHRIGEPFISGGLRTCDGTPQMIVATADWARIAAIAFDGTSFRVTDLGRYTAARMTRAVASCD